MLRRLAWPDGPGGLVRPKGDALQQSLRPLPRQRRAGLTPPGRKLGAKELTVSKATDEQIGRNILEGVKDKQGKQLMPSFKLRPEQVTKLVQAAKGFRKSAAQGLAVRHFM